MLSEFQSKVNHQMQRLKFQNALNDKHFKSLMTSFINQWNHRLAPNEIIETNLEMELFRQS